MSHFPLPDKVTGPFFLLTYYKSRSCFSYPYPLFLNILTSFEAWVVVLLLIPVLPLGLPISWTPIGNGITTGGG